MVLSMISFYLAGG